MKGKPAAESVIFKHNCRILRTTFKQAFLSLTCLDFVDEGCRIPAYGREECWG